MKRLLFVLPFLISILTSGQETSIVFEEGFEIGSVSELLINWDDSQNAAGMSLSNDVPDGSLGKNSLIMTYKPGENSGGHLFKLLPEGFHTLYARFYVKFISGHRKVHHLVKMGGNNPPSAWPVEKAGIKPAGDDRFITGIEPIGDSWSWDFYSYWMHMRGYGDPTYHWGNTFHPRSSS